MKIPGPGTYQTRGKGSVTAAQPSYAIPKAAR